MFSTHLTIRFISAAGACLFGMLAVWARFRAPVPYAVRDAFGGFAYVVLWILVCYVLLPQVSATRLAWAVLAVTCLLETLQLWHPVWLEQTRRTLPGRLLLGTTFEWNDFPPYIVGAVSGRAVVSALQRKARLRDGKSWE